MKVVLLVASCLIVGCGNHVPTNAKPISNIKTLRFNPVRHTTVDGRVNVCLTRYEINNKMQCVDRQTGENRWRRLDRLAFAGYKVKRYEYRSAMASLDAIDKKVLVVHLVQIDQHAKT